LDSPDGGIEQPAHLLCSLHAFGDKLKIESVPKGYDGAYY
jgi:hypothetical protein